MTAFPHAGTTALVTGASSGIGEQFVRDLAARGTSHIVISARRQEPLQRLADELAAEHGTTFTIITTDLSGPDGHRAITGRLGELGIRVDVLVNNAGFADYGRIGEQSTTDLLEQITLNCSSVVALTNELLPDMLRRGRGAIVNVASTAAFQPVPYMAVYGATKAFVLSFTEALWGELRRTPVRVLALCPGATETPFFDRIGTDDASVGKRQTPVQVVDTGLRALDRNRPTVVSGFSNGMLARTNRLVSRRTTITIAERTMHPSTNEPKERT